MGVLLDSTFLIAAERRGEDALSTLKSIQSLISGEAIGISVISVMELTHGAIRADTMIRRFEREEYLQDLIRAVPVHAVTTGIAISAGKLDALLMSQGKRLAIADILMAATALELKYRVVTTNVRHFERVPALELLVL